MSIEKSEWHHCNICKQSIHELKVKYGGPGKYFTQVFQQHIVQGHNMSLEEYFDLHDICPCGICNKFYRDGQKNNYCKKHMLKLIRFWESDILNIDLKEFICRLKK